MNTPTYNWIYQENDEFDNKYTLLDYTLFIPHIKFLIYFRFTQSYRENLKCIIRN